MHGENWRQGVCCNLVLLSLALQCHTQIHCAISKIDVEKDIQALVEETANSSAENKSEFLLTDYFVSRGWKDVSLMGTIVMNILGNSLWKNLRAIVKEICLFCKWNYWLATGQFLVPGTFHAILPLSFACAICPVSSTLCPSSLVWSSSLLGVFTPLLLVSHAPLSVPFRWMNVASNC